MKKHAPPKVGKLSTVKQRRLDELLEKNAEGTITAREKVRLEQLVAEAEQLMAANARRLAEFAQNEAPPGRTDAVPVTVWVQPQYAEP